MPAQQDSGLRVFHSQVTKRQLVTPGSRFCFQFCN